MKTEMEKMKAQAESMKAQTERIKSESKGMIIRCNGLSTGVESLEKQKVMAL